jgi:hypothetical protein
VNFLKEFLVRKEKFCTQARRYASKIEDFNTEYNAVADKEGRFN